MRLAVIACFLNEEAYLPTFLQSLAAQVREPDALLLVDDGSADGSVRLAEEFARGRRTVAVLRRPRRPAARDRLARAAELEAFCWAVEQVDIAWDVVAKLDADLRLSPDTFAELERRLEADPALGIAGACARASSPQTEESSASAVPPTTCADPPSSTGGPASSRSTRCRCGSVGYLRRTARAHARLAHAIVLGAVGGSDPPETNRHAGRRGSGAPSQWRCRLCLRRGPGVGDHRRCAADRHPPRIVAG